MPFFVPARLVATLEEEVMYLRARVAQLERQVDALHAQGLTLPEHVADPAESTAPPPLPEALQREIDSIEDATAREEMTAWARVQIHQEGRSQAEVARELFS